MTAPRIYRGDTWLRAWTLTNPAKRPIDLSGATARLHLRDKNKTLVYAASTANGAITVDGPAGKVALVVDAAITATLLGNYKFDLELTYSNGTVVTYESAVLVVLEDQTYD